MSSKELLAVNMERLINISDVKKEEKVYIMMPESRASEIQLIAKMFKERFKQPDYKDRHCKIWTSLEPGSWEVCLKSTTCLLLIHPEVPLGMFLIWASCFTIAASVSSLSIWTQLRLLSTRTTQMLHADDYSQWEM